MPNRKPYRILQATDFHLQANPEDLCYGANTDSSLHRVLDALMRQAKPDSLLVASGDLSDDGSAASYARVRQYLQQTGLDYAGLPGNHDNPELMRSYLDCPQRLTRAGWQLLFLDTTLADSPGGRISEIELNRTLAWLRRYPEMPCLIFMHHAALDIGCVWLDCMRISNSEAVLDRLTAYSQLKGIVFGHVHQALDIEYRNIRFLACPSTCFQFAPGSAAFTLDPIAPGFRWIDLYADGRIATAVERVA